MQTRQTFSRSPLARAIRGLIVVLAVGLAIYWAKFAPPPVSGGSKADSWAANWVKSRIYASIPPQEDHRHVRLTRENANGWYALDGEHIQSVEYYQAVSPTRPTAQRRIVVLQPIGRFSGEQQELLERLKQYCEVYFQLPVRIEKPLPLPVDPASLRATRVQKSIPFAGDKQYDSGYLISKTLKPRLPDDAVVYLGITMVDLWNGGLNYVFGVGSFEDRTGVYSLGRYYPEFWGERTSPETRTLTLRRSCQVLNHEAGHMFSIMHCVLYKCSMNGSNSLMDSDDTPIEPCPVCHRKLAWNLNWDEKKRTRELQVFYQKHGLSQMLKTSTS